MKTYKWAMVLILAVVIMGGIGAAQAEDFVLTVPLRLNNLHSQVEKILVSCRVMNDSGTLVGGYRGKDSEITVGPTGNVSQDLIVKFNAQPQFVVSDATKYECWFELIIKGETHPIIPNSYNAMALKSKPGTVFVHKVSGPIPKGGTATMIVPKMPK